MTEKLPTHLLSRCPEFPYKCDVCGKKRAIGNHSKCSKIRQEKHQQAIRNEEFDNLLSSGGLFEGKTFDQIWFDEMKES